MAKSIYIAGFGAGSGKSLITLGLMSSLSLHFDRFAFFKPIANIDESHEEDHYLELIKTYFNLPFKKENLFGYRLDEIERLVATAHYDEILSETFSRFKLLEEKSDFTVCEGTDYITEQHLPDEFNLNARIAANLGSQVIMVINGKGVSKGRLLEDIGMAIASFTYQGADVIGVVVNRIAPEEVDVLRDAISKKFKALPIVGMVTENPDLVYPDVSNIASMLKAHILHGEELTDRTVADYVVADSGASAFLSAYQYEGNLGIIIPQDREAMLLSCLLTQFSAEYPPIACLILSRGMEPSRVINKIIKGMQNRIPILSSPLTSVETASLLRDTPYRLNVSQPEKINLAIKHFQTHVDTKALLDVVLNHKTSKMTPQMFTYQLMEKARSDIQTIVLPEGEDPRIVEAACFLTKRNIAKIILLGDKSEIETVAKSINEDISNITILNPKTEDKMREGFADTYFELRKHKNLERATASDLMHDPNYFATMMLYSDMCDGVVSGAVHTTGETIRPALQVIKSEPGISTVSSIFLMCLKDRVLVYGDCAVIPLPDATQLSEIALLASRNAQAFGIEPRVAMLSYSSGDSGQGKSVDKVREATRLLKEKEPDLLVEGPIQYDAAVDPDVAKKKLPDSPVAGRATVLIFPGLNTGNNTYKAVQRETKAIAIGPILQGIRKPINDLSRGCTVDDVINTIIITAIQSQLRKQ